MAQSHTWSAAPAAIKTVAVLGFVLAAGGVVDGIVAIGGHPSNVPAGIVDFAVAAVYLVVAFLLIRANRAARLVAAIGAVWFAVSPLFARAYPLVLRLAVVSMYIVLGAIVLYLLYIPERSVDWFDQD